MPKLEILDLAKIFDPDNVKSTQDFLKKISTENNPEVINALRKLYQVGFELGVKKRETVNIVISPETQKHIDELHRQIKEILNINF